MIKMIYQRNDGLVKEGGDPVGLPVSRQMYRMKGTVYAMAVMMNGDTWRRLQFNDVKAMNYEVKAMGKPIYMRTYRCAGP
jgi:hypothetical protein